MNIVEIIEQLYQFTTLKEIFRLWPDETEKQYLIEEIESEFENNRFAI